jgi:dolichyl-phosphate-mannose-protein mannosyltransferase
MKRSLILVPLAAGAALRLIAYFANRSLWFDEAALAVNIIERPLPGIFKPLELHQGAPVGFLVAEKIITMILGPQEFALRLFPLICGLLTILVAVFVARLYVSSSAVPLATALVALSPPLIYYSAEAKQYSCDALVTLLLLWMFVELLRSDLRGRTMVAYALMGAAAVWFSHPSVFLLASAAGVFLFSARCDKTRAARLTLILAAWAASFAVLYFTSLRRLAGDRALLAFWSQYFPPRPLASIHTLSWLFDMFLVSFRDAAGLAIITGMGFFLVGCAALFRRNPRQAWILFGSFIALFLAAVAQKYPMGGRLLLFAVPIILLLVAEGVAAACARLPHAKYAQFIIGCLVLFQPTLFSVRRLWTNHPDDIRPVLDYAQARALPSDRWYIYFQAQPQMRYYSDIRGLRMNWIPGTDCGSDSRCYAKDIDLLTGANRTWIVLSHILLRGNTDDGAILIEQFDRKGRRLEEFRRSGARAYLYDLGVRTAGPDTRH